jgi:hypothetical protein
MEHRPKEMKPWVKARIDKKDVAPDIQPEQYGKSFVTWWTSLQPTSRKMVDGLLTQDLHDDENWDWLKKGGTAGFYTVIIALS